jgi:hypothetical protein
VLYVLFEGSDWLHLALGGVEPLTAEFSGHVAAVQILPVDAQVAISDFSHSRVRPLLRFTMVLRKSGGRRWYTDTAVR